MAQSQTFDNVTKILHPRKFALLVGITSCIMVFASLTSAYIVRKGQGNWLDFSLPNHFFYSTVFIVLSSILLQGSLAGFREGKEYLYKTLLVLGSFLGFGFVASQYEGWKALKEQGVYLGANASGDFLLLITGIHVAHVLAGITGLFLALIHAFYLPFECTPQRKLRYEINIMFWHFLGIVWLYLFVFILFI